MPRGRAANGSGTQPKLRSDGRWEVKYCAGHDPGTGKLIRKSIYGKTAEECAKKLRATVAAIDAGTYIEPERMPLGQWLHLWLNEYCIDIKERSRDNYRSSIETHIIPKLGAVPLCELQPHMVQQFINTLTDALSPKTIKNIHGVLHSALRKAVQVRYIRDNPADCSSLPRIEKKEIDFLSGEELSVFLQAIQGHKYERMFTVAVFTGMRQGELLGLCWDAVDLRRGTIKIKRQLQLVKGEYKLLTTKNSKPRTITPPGTVIDILKAQQKTQLEQRLKAGQMWDNPEGYVFTDETGRHVARNTLYTNYKRVLKDAGLPETLRFHDLRHSYAVFALETGDSVKEVQEALGHYSSAFTLDTYAHVSEDALKASAARKDAAIKAIPK